MNTAKETMNKSRKFFMRDNEITVRALSGENPIEVGKAFKDYFHVSLVEVYDEFGNHCLAVV